MRSIALTSLFTLAAIVSSGSAVAEPPGGSDLGVGYSANDAPLGAPIELRLDVRGQVAARCDLTAPVSGLDQIDINRAGSARSTFAIDCNTPFILRVQSERLGFASVDHASGVSAVTPYELSVALGTDRGRQDLGWCDASSLGEAGTGVCAYGAGAPGGGWSSGEAVAIRETGVVGLRWNAAQRGELPFGAYGDTIVIELEARP